MDNEREPAGTDELLGAVLDEAHYAASSRLPGIINRAASKAGIREAVVYLADYGQEQLIPLAGDGVPAREVLAIDQTFGGRAYRSIEALASKQEGGDLRVWVPLLDGSARLGVLEARVASLDPVVARQCRHLAALVATLVASKELYADALARSRRARPLSLAAEMQWGLLPPLTFSDGRVTVSGALEPSYRIAGDSFDYALDEDIAHIAIVDAMGHGFEAAIMAAVAINAYRHARRHGHDLAETYRAMNEAVASQFPGDRFATAQILLLEPLTGMVRWINAGHPPPLLLRGSKIIGAQSCAPSLPLGLGGQVEDVGQLSFEPGDRLLLVSDGVLEARSPDGTFFGEGPLPHLLTRELATELPGPEVLRRLVRSVVEHQDGDLQDDATTVLIEWGGREPVDPFPPQTPA